MMPLRKTTSCARMSRFNAHSFHFEFQLPVLGHTLRKQQRATFQESLLIMYRIQNENLSSGFSLAQHVLFQGSEAIFFFFLRLTHIGKSNREREDQEQRETDQNQERH